MFGAALRYRIGAAGRHDPPHLMCQPCGLVLSPPDFDIHIAGCVRQRGHNCRKKHDSLRDTSAHIAEEAGLEVEKEPRDFKSSVCSFCGEKFSCNEGPAHKLRCSPGARFRPTGPDIVIHWDHPTVTNSAGTLKHTAVYDWTVVHATAASHEDASLKQLFAAKRVEKERLYREIVEEVGASFVVLCVSSHGVFSPEVIKLVKDLARATGDPANDIAARFRTTLARGNGRTLHRARARRFQQ